MFVLAPEKDDGPRERVTFIVREDAEVNRPKKIPAHAGMTNTPEGREVVYRSGHRLCRLSGAKFHALPHGGEA